MELPEASLINSEVTLRDLQLTQEVKLTKKSLIRWIALSSGLISPKESRRTLIDLLEVLFKFQLDLERDPDAKEIVEEMQKLDPKHNEKAVRYHLTQLKKTGLLESDKGKFRFPVAPFSEKGDVAAGFEHVLKTKSENSIAKIKQAVNDLKRVSRGNPRI